MSLVQLALLALSTAPQTLTLDPSDKKSSAAYTCVHKLHKFTGTSHDLKGVAKIAADGTVQVQIAGPVKGFDSENGNRDEHMQETVEAVKFPNVVVKCLTHVTGNVSQKAKADCLINLHGQDQKVPADLDLTFEGSKVRATGSLVVSWDGFGIKRPQLLFVPIDDKGDVSFDVAFLAQ